MPSGLQSYTKYLNNAKGYEPTYAVIPLQNEIIIQQGIPESLLQRMILVVLREPSE